MEEQRKWFIAKETLPAEGAMNSLEMTTKDLEFT